MNGGWICPHCGTPSFDDFCDVCTDFIDDDFYYDDDIDYDLDFEDAF